MEKVPYRENSAINFSCLKEMKKSPLEYKLARDYPSEATDAQRLGTLVHCGLLEGSLEVENRYIVIPEINWQGKANKEKTLEGLAEPLGLTEKVCGELLGFKKAELLDYISDRASVVGKIPVPESSSSASDKFTWEKAEKIINTNRNKPVFLEFWDSMQWVEKELYGVCEVTGLELKGLVDALTTKALADLKTTGTIGKIWSSIRAYSYIGQVAYYDYLCRLNGITKDKFYIIFVETVSPYKMKVVEIDELAIRAEHEENIKLLQKVKACQEADKWSDGSEEIEFYEHRGEDGDTSMSEEAWLDQTENDQF